MKNDSSSTIPTPPVDMNLLSAILKSPDIVASAIAENPRLLAASLLFLVAGTVFYSGFGVAVGLFGGWSVALLAAVKAPLIGLCSLILCLPSLYVFSAVGGTPLSLRQALALGASCMAMMGIILIGLAPVAWLFAVSTSALPFMVMLIFFLWMLALGFTIRYVRKLRVLAFFQRGGGVTFWLMILALVSLQMTTCMRPVLTKPDQVRGWWTSEKQFFLNHFVSCFDEPAAPPGSPGPSRRR